MTATLPLAPWLSTEAVARELAESVGRVIETGTNVGVGRVVRLNPPSRKYSHGSVRVVNQYGEGDTLDFVRLRDDLRRRNARFIESLDEVRFWVFKSRSGMAHLVGRDDPLFCTLANTRVRFRRMVDPSPGGKPTDWLVEVASNADGSVLPDLRRPNDVFAYGV